jgi:predicted aconitase with swiveling domain/8-oxo-dGTP pyrophosphatase MutT (NUDIX family)
MKLRARRISPGRAEGRALVCPGPFSFVGGADPSSGELLDAATGHAGEALGGRIFAFPHGKGSTVGSYALYGLAKRGLGPAALINEHAEAIVATGAILGGVPMVDHVDLGAFVTGDRVAVDADHGTVDLPEVEEKPVVSAFLRNRGRFLVVRRSDRVGSFQGRWSAISGYVEGKEEPRARAAQEIREETSMKGARFRAAAEAVITRHENTAFVVHPFLFDAPTRRVRLDWENVEYRWIAPRELNDLDTVPRLDVVLERILNTQYLRKR